MTNLEQFLLDYYKDMKEAEPLQRKAITQGYAAQIEANFKNVPQEANV